MENEVLFMWIIGAFGGLVGGMLVCLLYLLNRLEKLRDEIAKRFDIAEERSAKRFDIAEERSVKRFGDVEERSAKRFGDVEERSAKRFGDVEERMNKMSGRLENAIGSLSTIQEMFKEVMGWLGRSLGAAARGHRGEASAGETEDVEKAGGDARRNAPRNAPPAPPSGPHP